MRHEKAPVSGAFFINLRSASKMNGFFIRYRQDGSFFGTVSQNEPAFSSLANHSMSSRQAAGSGAYSALTKAAEFRRCHGV